MKKKTISKTFLSLCSGSIQQTAEGRLIGGFASLSDQQLFKLKGGVDGASPGNPANPGNCAECGGNINNCGPCTTWPPDRT